MEGRPEGSKVHFRVTELVPLTPEFRLVIQVSSFSRPSGDYLHVKHFVDLQLEADLSAWIWEMTRGLGDHPLPFTSDKFQRHSGNSDMLVPRTMYRGPSM